LQDPFEPSDWHKSPLDVGDKQTPNDGCQRAITYLIRLQPVAYRDDRLIQKPIIFKGSIMFPRATAPPHANASCVNSRASSQWICRLWVQIASAIFRQRGSSSRGITYDIEGRR